jgi:hypothetical protein
MKTRTKDLLGRLDGSDWFSTVGQPLPEPLRGSVIPVSSWVEAVECCSSIEWENFGLEQRNQLTMNLSSHARDRYRKWNDITDSIKKVIEPLVAKKLASVAKKIGGATGRKQIQNNVKWDMLGACMELEYSDVREPNFFCGLMELYYAGRFPCGWGEVDDAGKVRLLGPIEEDNYDPNETDPQKWVFASMERVYNAQVQLPFSGKLVIY